MIIKQDNKTSLNYLKHTNIKDIMFLNDIKLILEKNLINKGLNLTVILLIETISNGVVYKL